MGSTTVIETKVLVDTAQATRSLDTLVWKYKEVESAQQKVTTTTKTITKDTAAAVSSVSNLGSSLSNVWWAGSKTFSQLSSWGRNTEMFLWAITGLSVQKAVSNLKDFSSAFWLLNATIRMKMPESISMVKNAMFEISNSTWEAVKQVTDSMNQLLSSGVTPTATEGTELWKKQMKDVIDIQKQVSMWALWMWETSNNIWEAWVKFIHSTWGDVNDPKKWNEAISLMAATLDRWVWFMTEYTNQFARFNLPATQIWWSKPDTMALFASFTKDVNPQMAGLYTQNIARFMQRAIPEANSGRVQAKVAARMLTGVKNQGWWIEKADADIITKMPSSMFADFFIDKNWQERGATDMLSHVNAVYSQIKSKAAQWEFLYEITAGNTRAVTAITAALKNIGDIKNMSKEMDEIVSRGTIGIEKFAIMHETFAGWFNRFTNTINNFATQSLDALTPALSALMATMWQPFGGESGWTAKDLDDMFWRAKEWVAALPAQFNGLKWPLNYVVDKMHEFNLWMMDDAWHTWFKNMTTAAMDLASALWAVAGAIIDIGWSPLFQQLIWAVSAHPNLAIASLFGYNLVWWVWWIWGTLWWALWGWFMDIIWPSLVWGSVWLAIWYAMFEWWKSKQDADQKKLNDALSKPNTPESTYNLSPAYKSSKNLPMLASDLTGKPALNFWQSVWGAVMWWNLREQLVKQSTAEDMLQGDFKTSDLMKNYWTGNVLKLGTDISRIWGHPQDNYIWWSWNNLGLYDSWQASQGIELWKRITQNAYNWQTSEAMMVSYTTAISKQLWDNATNTIAAIQQTNQILSGIAWKWVQITLPTSTSSSGNQPIENVKYIPRM